MIKLLESTRFFKVQMTKNVMPNIENTMGGINYKIASQHHWYLIKCEEACISVIKVYL